MADAGGSNLRSARAYLGLAVRKEGRPAAKVGSESYVAWGCELRWQERGRKREKEVACSLIKLERSGGSSPQESDYQFSFSSRFFFLFFFFLLASSSLLPLK